ncbi:hypothetical protein [Lentibacillus daqui]|uniref:hypothetical protein n=1 Tax=Lentibacillus daqui TaxID=2911514 RepID=UPI0022B0B219|nr:hypothetical protein [Lentibacillus daqui]
MDNEKKELNGLGLSIEQILTSKGIQIGEGHVNVLESRWQALEELKGNLENAKIDDADIAVRNIPGGDHVE